MRTTTVIPSPSDPALRTSVFARHERRTPNSVGRVLTHLPGYPRWEPRDTVCQEARRASLQLASHGLTCTNWPDKPPGRGLDTLRNIANNGECETCLQPRSCSTARMTAQMARKRKPTTDAVEIMHRKYFEGKPGRLQELEEERASAEVARQIYELRQTAGLTQQELAKLVGTTPSVICRLEDADYAGHSLSMLRRIAAALDRRVEIRFVPVRGKGQRAT